MIEGSLLAVFGMMRREENEIGMHSVIIWHKMFAKIFDHFEKLKLEFYKDQQKLSISCNIFCQIIPLCKYGYYNITHNQISTILFNSL